MQRRAAPGTEADRQTGRQAEFKINPNKRIKEQKPNTNVNLPWRWQGIVAVPEGGGAGVPYSHRKLLVVRAKGEKIFSTLPAIML